MEHEGRILVVDDEEGMRSYLHFLLEGVGYEVECAGSGAVALELMDQQSFDVVLADIKMPNMSGLEMLRRIKQTDPRAVVIVMTAYSSLQFAIQAARYEAFNYLTKPFESRSEVLSAVARGLDERRKRAESESSE